ncbi:MAG: SGNH/GDSL hydrolase family protein, partial [Candidatus Thermoplasmatota archaeon]|nr:SGNH/GDSL hydrolase family protein [Candidatus Thermoplasmatota archaeon]
MRAQILLTLLLVSSVFATMPANAQGRAIEFEVELSRYDWLSNETIPMDVQLKNAQFNTDYTLIWTLVDEDNLILDNGSMVVQATGTITSNLIELKHFYNTKHFYTFEVDLLDASGARLAQTEHSFTVFQNRVVAPIGNLLVFGDSLSDMGNAKDSILNVPDVPPYWQGRFSNGMVWVEYLSQAYGVTTTYGSGTSAGDNRAFGGAQTGAGFSYLLLPNVGSQISSYLSNVQSNFASNDGVSLWAGGTDFLYGPANADTIVTNMESHIRQLEAAGATTFVIPNLPPLEKTPEILSRSQTQQQNIASEVASYNNKLASLVSSLQLELGIVVYSVDAYTIFNDIIDNKEALGLTNTQSAACSGNPGLLPLPICNNGD